MTTVQVYPEKECQITSSACTRLGDSARFLVILLAVSVTAFILQPRLGVRDEDAYSYIIGAYSIHAGSGYNDLNGEPLNHYPPVYSLILSLFASPLLAGLFLNYLAFGAAVALIYRLAREQGKWAEPAALGLALAVGFIFLRRLATNASPDVLTYALFLLALHLYYKSSSRLRMTSYLIWGLVIPIKLIAVIFIPAAVIVRYLGKPMRAIRAEGNELLVAVGSWLLFLSISLAYNFLTIQTLLPQSHLGARPDNSPYDLIGAASQFLVSIPRNFLSNWYGSLGVASALIPFIIVLLVALVCLLTLRLHSSQMAWHAILLVLLSVLLQFGSRQVAGARLVGYGFITLFLALYPVGKWHKMWVVYGLLGIALSAFNAFTQNSLGANDPRYVKLAHESLKIGAFPKGILTNSFHILDLHAKIPTRYIYSAEQLNEAEYFFWVSLPKYDAIASTVSSVERLGEGWCEVASLTGAKLFRKCPQPMDAYEK
jgi:hypothetical protein